MFSEIKHLIKKEVTLEWRQKYAFSGVLLYVISTVFVCYLSFKRIIDVPTWNALFWIIILFASVNAVAKSFLQESAGRMLYFYTIASPQAMVLSKIIYNAALVTVLSVICFGVYSMLVGSIVQNITMFLINLVLGSFGLSAILTLISAIASKTNNNVTLMAILSFPIVLPLLIVLIRLSKNAIDGLAWAVNMKYIIALIALNVIVLILSFLLFPYLWRD
ncbi:MAG: ABC transporter permease [Flavobacteriales bacterium]|nr:MAG: ABC transporter permease [Flavobacteriales bacterium]